MMKIITTLLITTCVYSVCAEANTNRIVDCKNTFKGIEYNGTQSTTLSGYTCQRWNSNTPHKKSRTSSDPLNFPEKNLDAAANYCRNPDGEPVPWCYTNDPSVRYEFCYIPLCNTLLTNKTSNITKSDECRKSLNSKEYNGTRSTTMSGYTCQRWNSNTPHKKSGKSSNPLNFPEKSLDAAENFCRNPEGESLPWCYTTDPSVRYEYCDIPLCNMENNDSKVTKSDYTPLLVLRNNVKDTSVKFDKSYAEFELGFGNRASGNYFAGLQFLNAATATNRFGVRIELTDVFGVFVWEEWKNINIGPASDGYRLQMSGRNTNSTTPCILSDCGMFTHLNSKFSTFDKDQDNRPELNCADVYYAGWWYNNCGAAILTEQYEILWQIKMGEAASIAKAEMYLIKN